MATNLMIGVFLVISIVMILTVLIQRPQGGGLSGAFGAGSSGGGAGQTAFGTKTGDVLTWATITIFILFVLFAIILNFATRPQKAPARVPVVTVPASEEDTSSDSASSDSASDATDTPASDAQSEMIDLSGDTGIDAPAEPKADPAADLPETDLPETTPEDG